MALLSHDCIMPVYNLGKIEQYTVFNEEKEKTTTMQQVEVDVATCLDFDRLKYSRP